MGYIDLYRGHMGFRDSAPLMAHQMEQMVNSIETALIVHNSKYEVKVNLQARLCRSVRETLTKEKNPETTQRPVQKAP